MKIDVGMKYEPESNHSISVSISVSVPFLYPLKTFTKGFSTFSWSIEIESNRSNDAHFSQEIKKMAKANSFRDRSNFSVQT